MSLDLKSVELFIRVAKLGAMGKAGAEFGLSPTATTQRIRALEAALGTPLLNRTTRTVSLSTDGEVFLTHAQRIVSNVEDAVADVQNDTSAVRGELRIAGSASFGRRFIAPYIGEFLEEHPEASVQLHLSDAVFDIIEHGYDLAIRLGVPQSSTLQSRKLAPNPRIVVAAPSYIERHGLPAHPEDLQNHNCLTLGETRSWTMSASDGSVSETKVQGNFKTNYAEAVTEGVLSGIGIARKCQWEIAEHLTAGTLIPVLEEYTILPEWNVFALRPPALQAPTRVRVFTDFLKSKYARLSRV